MSLQSFGTQRSDPQKGTSRGWRRYRLKPGTASIIRVQSQRVQIDHDQGLGAQKPYQWWTLGSNLLIMIWTPLGRFISSSRMGEGMVAPLARQAAGRVARSAARTASSNLRQQDPGTSWALRVSLYTSKQPKSPIWYGLWAQNP